MSLKHLLSRFKNRKSGPSICHPEGHPETGFEGIPDFVEPLLGWRAWKVWAPLSDSDACPGFSSVILDTPWAPRRRFSAKHSFDLGAKCRGLLGLDCSCGIYAFNDPLEAFVYLMRVRDRLLGMSVDVAIGTVSLWGKVVECELGYKAEYAYPEHIFLPASFARFLPMVSSAFGVAAGVYASTCRDELSLTISSAFGGQENTTLHLKNSGSLRPRDFPYEVGFYDLGTLPGEGNRFL
ncbi:MAG: hypothetical protein WB819_14900 [Terriglobia bacterium]